MDYSKLEKSGTLLASAARTASVNSETQANEGFRGVRVCINATASAATPSVVFTIKARDPVSGQWYTLLVSAAVTGAGVTWLTVYPGATVAANAVVSLPLGREWRLEAVAADADSLTYSASFTYLY